MTWKVMCSKERNWSLYSMCQDMLSITKIGRVFKACFSYELFLNDYIKCLWNTFCIDVTSPLLIFLGIWQTTVNSPFLLFIYIFDYKLNDMLKESYIICCPICSRWYNIGQLSVQRAAAWVLEKYYQDFTIYNPYLDRVPSKKKPHPSNSSFKYYDVDGNEENPEVS